MTFPRYIVSESVDAVLSAFCWSSGDGPARKCTTGAGDAMASGTGIVQAGVDNTLLGVIFRALWAIVGGHRSELAQDAPDACARSVADSTYAGPWDLCHKYYSVVLLWALLNVLFIVVLGVWMARRGIMIKL